MEGLPWLAEIAFRHFWQSALIFCIASLLISAHPKWSAEHKSWIWSFAFLFMGLMPILTLLPIPTLNLGWLTNNATTAAAEQPSLLNALNNAYQFDADLISPFISQTSDALLSIQNVLLGILFIWVILSARAVTQIIFAAFETKQISESADEVATTNLPHNLNWPAHVPIKVSKDIDSPMAVGIFKPYVVLPKNLASTLSPEQLHHVLSHELAHIVRGDVLFNLIQRSFLAIFWWSPLLHLAYRKLHTEREMACDDRAVLATGSSKEYATSLLDSAELLISSPLHGQNLLAVGAFEEGKSNFFSKRIRRLVKSDYRCDLKVNGLQTSALCLAAVLVATIFTLSPRTAFSANSTTMKAAELCDAFVDAIYEKDYDLKSDLFDQGADTNCISSRGLTPLIASAVNGEAKVTHWLLQKGADPALAPNNKVTPLIKASSYDHVDVIKKLLAAGADPNQKVYGEKTALFYAAKKGHYDSVKYLLKADADPNHKIWIEDEAVTAYQLAKENGHKKTASLIKKFMKPRGR